MADRRVDPSDALYAPCETGYTSVVGMLLADPRVDPTANGHESIVAACRVGHVKTVRLLLRDGRAHPMAGNGSNALYSTVTSYCTEALRVCRALLADPMVDPSSNCHRALQLAEERGGEMVRLIFERCGGTLSEENKKEIRHDYSWWEDGSGSGDASDGGSGGPPEDRSATGDSDSGPNGSDSDGES